MIGRGSFVGAAALCLVCTSAWAADQDQDGVLDGADVFPCDAQVSGEAFAPAQGVHGMLLFEDQWPSRGDLDTNDAVVTYNYVYQLDPQGRAVRVRATFNVLALGGDYLNGLGLHLPIARGAVASVTRTLGAGSPQPLVPAAADGELTVVVSSNLRELFGGAAGPINSIPSALPATAAPITVEVVLSTPSTIALEQAPHDVYLFRAQDPGHEIHRPAYAGTAAMHQSLFGSADDGSAPGRNFVDTSGLPAVLVVPDTTPYPAEGVAISSLFPNILTFASSGGALAQDFYTTPVDTAAYSAAGAPAASFPGADAYVPDVACVPVCSPGEAACPAASCRQITAGNGVYWLDPNGGAPNDAYQAYCEAGSDEGWIRLSAAAWPFLFTGSNWFGYQEDQPDAANFSILHRRQDFADTQGCYTLRLQVGNTGTWQDTPAHETIWRQCHDPFSQTTDGSDYTYVSGDVPSTCGGFNGLHHKYQGYSYTSDPDSNDSVNCWWMQVVPNRNYNSRGYLEGYGGTGNYHNWQTLWIRTNQAPVINSLTANPSTPVVGQPLSITAAVTDAENDNLTYTWSVSNNTWTLSGQGANVTLTPGSNVTSPVTVDLTVTDAYGARATDSLFFCPPTNGLAVYASCQDALTQGQTADGLYFVDGGQCPIPVYCDQSSDGGGWIKMESVSWPFLFDGANWDDLNVDDPLAANYSRLADRARFADAQGCFTFRLEVGNSGDWTSAPAHTTVWQQCHDPFTQSTTGNDYTYISGQASTTCGGFNGLHDRYTGYSYTSDPDSTDAVGCWWMQVVPHSNYNSRGYLEGYNGSGNYHIWQSLWIR